LWDIGAVTKGTTEVQAKAIFRGHKDVVEDVAWHHKHRDIFGSVGDDKKLIL
jgi:histone-binding protein RBBP4